MSVYSLNLAQAILLSVWCLTVFASLKQQLSLRFKTDWTVWPSYTTISILSPCLPLPSADHNCRSRSDSGLSKNRIPFDNHQAPQFPASGLGQRGRQTQDKEREISNSLDVSEETWTQAEWSKCKNYGRDRGSWELQVRPQAAWRETGPVCIQPPLYPLTSCLKFNIAPVSYLQRYRLGLLTKKWYT